MLNDLTSLVVATMLMYAITTVVLVGYWLQNRATLGLAKIVASSAATGIGLFLAFAFGPAEAYPHVLAIYAFLILGQVTAWIGIAEFWHQKTKRLLALMGLAGFVTWASIAFYQLGGGDPAVRTAVASTFLGLGSLAIIITIMTAKGLSIDIYESAFKESRVGSYVLVLLFAAHGALNFYRVFSWPGFGFEPGLLVAENAYIPAYTLLEALIFMPIFGLGVVIMVAERLQTELRVEQMLEPVTRSLNRRAFLAVAKIVLARARRNADAVSVLMAEVGNFREIRDSVGSSGCDAILKQVAHAVVAGRREQDIFGRFSNDEFLLILPGTPEEGALQVEERVAAEINGRNYIQKGRAVKVDVTLQCHTARGEDLEPEGMVDAVAKKLATAKSR